MPRNALFIGHASALAGAEISLARFTSYLNRASWMPRVLLPDKGPITELLQAGRVPVLTAPYHMLLEHHWDALNVYPQIKALRSAILDVKPEVILINTDTIPQAVIAALTTDIPIVLHFHAFLDRVQYPRLNMLSLRQAGEAWFSFPEKIIGCSPWVTRLVQAWLGRDVVPIPNIAPAPTSVVSYAERETPPLVVMLTTLEPHKRVDLFIDVAAQVREKYPDLRFKCEVYGNGHPDYEAKLRQRISRKRVDDFFKLLPRTPATSDIYNRASVVLVLSDIEPFSMVTIEAYAHGVPVIATASGGPDDLIVEGETGHLVEIGAGEAVVDRLAALLRDRGRASQMGANARRRFEASYTKEAVMPHYEAALEEAISLASANAVRRRAIQPLARYFMNKGG
ncbi:MAG: hypothetical protein OHK0023_14710 [Anaerolineae bacterium]